MRRTSKEIIDTPYSTVAPSAEMVIASSVLSKRTTARPTTAGTMTAHMGVFRFGWTYDRNAGR